MATDNWILMPALNCAEYTLQAAADCLAQTGVSPRLLIVNQGSDDPTRAALEALAARDPRVLVWSHDPCLPSLSATWNTALDFVWGVGGREALVVNNDIRMDPWTYHTLRTRLILEGALFVSAVGWHEQRWMDTMFTDREAAAPCVDQPISKGGPDFSCFVTSKEGHEKYRFDESFIPAYCEDLDMHRRYMLGGDGARIFSVNLPYLHYASRTVNSFTPEQQAQFHKRVAGARAYYARKWGGPVNAETFFSPFDEGQGYSTAGMPNPPTTPALQAWVQAGSPVVPEEVPNGQDAR